MSDDRDRIGMPSDGSHVRPIALDGDVGFIEIDSVGEAERVQSIFAIQWDFVHGWVDESALARLPARFAGRRVVRDPRELLRLARRGGFNIDELYRELFE